MDVLRLVVEQWDRFDGLVHGFLGRGGGRSQPPYASLNLSYDNGDDTQTVKQNWCDLKLAVGLHDFSVVTAKQVHGDTILRVSSGIGKRAGVGDGLMTDATNVFVGVMAADCVPLLFLEPERKIVAAVHAGWRGGTRLRHRRQGNRPVEGGLPDRPVRPSCGDGAVDRPMLLPGRNGGCG